MARVLVVEDDPDLLALEAEELAEAGHDVRTATNGEEALQRLEPRPNVILLDLMMPVMDGLQFLRRLRDLPAHTRTPVVVVSAIANTAWSQAIGADGFVKKPFDLQQLHEVVSSHAPGA